jgi:hypothetical protein
MLGISSHRQLTMGVPVRLGLVVELIRQQRRTRTYCQIYHIYKFLSNSLYWFVMASLSDGGDKASGCV